MIRCAAILQLLLGNMGRPGGGILALRGHCLDSGLHGCSYALRHSSRLFEHAEIWRRIEDSRQLHREDSSRTGWWHNLDKYICQLVEGLLRESAQPENEFGFHWLPRVTGDHSHQGYWLDMLDGKMDGFVCHGPKILPWRVRIQAWSAASK